MANFYTDNEALKFQFSHPLMPKIVQIKEKDYSDKNIYPEAPVDFEDAVDNYDKVMDILGGICGDIIYPNAEDVDHEGPCHKDGRVKYAPGTQQNHDVLVQAGVYAMNLPRKYDGLNFSMVPYVMAAEIVSRADAGFGNIWGLQDCAETIYEFASDELKDKYLSRIAKGDTCSMDLTEPDAGSDLGSVQLKATWSEKDNCWLLNGVKRFITNGDADIKLVLARSEEGTSDARGLSYFLLENKKDNSLRVRRIENKLGIKGSPTCELVFVNAKAQIVGERKFGLIKYVMSLMNGARLGVGAQSVGISEAAYREGLAYAKERRQFGKAIIDFPAVSELLVNMKAKLDASRALLYETTRFVDIYKGYGFLSKDRQLSKEERDEQKEAQKLADMLTPLLKLFSSEYCNQNAYDAIQIHGGSGFMKDYPVERLYRDARITSIYEGTSQLQVVSAIRGVTTGVYLKRIKVYETMTVNPELETLRSDLIAMTQDYETALAKVLDVKDSSYIDFHARRLVEMAGHIIMGYLLVVDATRNDMFVNSAKAYVKYGYAQVKAHFAYIEHFDLNQLGIFLTIH